LVFACSKGFLQPANDAVRSLRLHRLTGVKLASFPCLQEVDASTAADWSESWLVELLQHVPLLAQLKLPGPLTFVGAEVLGGFARLQRLDLTGPLADSVLHRLPALRHTLRELSLRECCTASGAALAVALSPLYQLEEADLSMCTHLSDATLEQIAAGCPRLIKLHLTGCEAFRWAGKACGMLLMPNLGYIRMLTTFALAF
jgi:F-box/leucine-rich repeat protein 2/20